MSKQTKTKLALFRLVLVLISVTGVLSITSTNALAGDSSCGYDYSSAYNHYGGAYNSPLVPASLAFAALKADGSIAVWGHSDRGGSGAPVDAGYVSIASNAFAFAALKADGSITAWGGSGYGGSGAPTDSGYVSIASTDSAFAAFKPDGSITAWGNYGSYEDSSVPMDTGYVSIASNARAFAALKADGSITAWGGRAGDTRYSQGGSGAPTDSGYISIASSNNAFAALNADGSITAWGYPSKGGRNAPTDNGYVSIASSYGAFAALKSDGSITAWGYGSYGGYSAHTDSGYVSIASTDSAFAAFKPDGSITAWGGIGSGGSGAPTDSGYVSIASTSKAFAALKPDGSINAWGRSDYGGGLDAPTDSGYVSITSTSRAFAALKADGSITAWGGSGYGGSGAPTDSGYLSIASNAGAFAALKADGSITAWGRNSWRRGDVHPNAPTDNGYISINGAPGENSDCGVYANKPNPNTDQTGELCEIRTDYADYRCEGVFKVYSLTDLEDYLSSDFGRNEGIQFKHLSIMNDLDKSGDELIIESPCNIKLANGVNLTAETLELDGRTGVIGSKSNVLNTPMVCLLSEQGNVLLGENSVVTANKLSLRADKTAKIGRTSNITVTDTLAIESTGQSSKSSAIIGFGSVMNVGILNMSASQKINLGRNTTIHAETIRLVSNGTGNSDIGIKSGALVEAGELSILSDYVARIGSNTTVTAAGNLEMSAADESQCKIKRSATITFATKSGVCAPKLPGNKDDQEDKDNQDVDGFNATYTTDSVRLGFDQTITANDADTADSILTYDIDITRPNTDVKVTLVMDGSIEGSGLLVSKLWVNNEIFTHSESGTTPGARISFDGFNRIRTTTSQVYVLKKIQVGDYKIQARAFTSSSSARVFSGHTSMIVEIISTE